MHQHALASLRPGGAMLDLRGTDISNPPSSSGESGANLSLAGIRLSRSRIRGFPRLSGPGRAAWVGRDTRVREYLAEKAVISLSGPIPVPHRR